MRTLDLYHAITLGIVQGLTEFLPISSSGHLVISRHLFGLSGSGIAFGISVHVGTLLAVLIYFRLEIRSLIIAVTAGGRRLATRRATLNQLFTEDVHFRLAVLIVLGTIPTAVVGLIVHTYSEQLFSSLALAGGMLVVTGLILVITGIVLWLTRMAVARGRGPGGLTIGEALIIGLVQGLAVVPGISRSGSTIAAGLLLGLNRETAGTYSFLLSIPAIIGAALLSLTAAAGTEFEPGPALIGTIVSFAVGYLALRFLMRLVKQGKLYLFAPYCWVVGLIALVFGL